MAKDSQNPGYWKPGQSGNPNGRPRKARALTEMLRVQGDEPITYGDQAITAREALAKAVWQFALTGEVWLMGKKLEAHSAAEWASVVKWLYNHVEPGTLRGQEAEPELIVRVLREDQRDRVTPLSPLPQGEGE